MRSFEVTYTNPRMYVHMAHKTLLEWQQVREHTTRREAGASNSNGVTSHNQGRSCKIGGSTLFLK